MGKKKQAKGGTKAKVKKSKAAKKSAKKQANGRGGIRKQQPQQEERQAAPEPKVNPYETFQNKKRHRKVLGERSQRSDRRDLLTTRANAARTRTAGLLKEVAAAGRKTKFADKRIGAGLDQSASFIKLRTKETKKTFNLSMNKAEDLTVGGRNLSSIADADLKADGGPRSDDEWADDVEAGGGLEDIVAKSKQAKAEAQQERQELEEKLGVLDDDYKDILGDLAFKLPKAQQPLEEKAAPDDYDRLMRQMATATRVAAADRTKTPEEMARDKAEELEALERKRVARAEGVNLDEENAGSDGEDTRGGPRLGGGEDSDGGDSGECEESEEEGGAGDECEGSESGAEEGGEGGNIDEDDLQGEGLPEFVTSLQAAALDITKNGPGESELPYVPEIPSIVKHVADLLDGKQPLSALKLVQRVRAVCAAKQVMERKASLRGFFPSLLSYVLGAMSREDGDLSMRGVRLMYALRTPLLEMSMEHPDAVYEFFKKKLEEMAGASLPRAKEFSCLKLIALLFPVTDLTHPLCTSAAILADHWASNLARLGSGMQDLVSEGAMLFEILYQYCVPAGRFCPSFFGLGVALLETCWGSTGAAREQCVGAFVCVARLLVQALAKYGQEEVNASASMARHLLLPTVRRLCGDASDNESIAKALGELDAACRLVGPGGLKPLALFESARAQIRVFDPVFHEAGGKMERGAEVTDAKMLQRKLVKERRNAARQLARDALVLQQVQHQKDANRVVKRKVERKRVSTIMADEKEMLKKLGTEDAGAGGGMDTSLQSYSKKKQEKRDNQRMGGDATADNKAEKKVSGPAAKAAAKNKARRRV